ncbi:hypothetical protein G9464_02490 [Halostella sp. JP-L12]|uniref:hypothetical protein n=1 Tax=Halostella TaxID=1843185 RepID=UPI0013CEA0E7|nr:MULTISPECIES: hypothetical protein [Halostella]NHN46470.1 hypothetical protein [Halostella sp. JP-L12]
MSTKEWNEGKWMPVGVFILVIIMGINTFYTVVEELGGFAAMNSPAGRALFSLQFGMAILIVTAISCGRIVQSN